MKHLKLFEDFQSSPNSISVSLLDPKHFDLYGRAKDGLYPHLDDLLSPEGLQMTPDLYYPILKLKDPGRWIYLTYNDEMKDIVLIVSKEHANLSPDLGIGIENQKKMFPDEGIIDNTYEDLSGVDLNPDSLPLPGSPVGIKSHFSLDGTSPGSTALAYTIRRGEKSYIEETPTFKVI